jgi:hypothetical protein
MAISEAFLISLTEKCRSPASIDLGILQYPVPRRGPAGVIAQVGFVI